MSFSDERQSIENRFKTEWTATPIAFDNVPFNPPNNADWVRLNIQNGDSGYRALGCGTRHTGIINVQIFTPVNSATMTSRQYADIVSDIFSNQRFDDIVTDVSSINLIGDDKAWFQINVTTPYYRDAEQIFVPVPIFEPLYVLLNSTKLEINVNDPEIIMQGEVDVITPSRLEISGVIAGTFNYVTGIAIYVDGVAIGTGTTLNKCHDDCAFVVFHTAIGSDNFMFINPYHLVTGVLGSGIHTIEIGIIGKWLGISHTIFIGNVDTAGMGLPSSSTLIVKELRAIPPVAEAVPQIQIPDAVNIDIYTIEELEQHFGSGGTYNITTNVSITFMAGIVIDGVFNIESGVNLIIQSANHAHIVEFTNTGTIFTHAGLGELRITQGKFKFSGNNATIFDLNVTNLINNWVSLTCTGTGIKLGSVTALSIFKITNSTITGFTDGFTINTNLFALNGNLFQTTQATTNTVFTFANIAGTAAMENTYFFIGETENIFYIDPANTAQFQITRIASSLNIGNFFQFGSLTETSKHVVVEKAGIQIASNTGTAMSVKENISATTITGGWDSLNLGSVILGDLNSRFELINESTGERKYNGLFPIKVGGSISISAERSGGAVAHSFRMIKTVDTSGDPFDDVEMQRDIGGTIGSISFPFSGTLYPGDQFRPEVMATTGTTPIIIASYSDIIQ